MLILVFLCFTTIPSDYKKYFGVEGCFLTVKNPPRNACLDPPRNRSNPPRNTPCYHWTDFTLPHSAFGWMFAVRGKVLCRKILIF